jgi:Zn-dependent metalloprotease
MSRRWTVLAGALAIALAAPQATAAMASPGEPDQQRVRPEGASDVENGLDRLRADAVGRLKVHRETDGTVDFVSSTNGRAMLEGDEGASPRRTAQDQLARYGEAFGIDGGRSRAVVRQTLDSSTGGSIVRADQVVDGVPVFGGQIVMSLDEDQGVVSVDAATTEATQVADAMVSEVQAQRSAVAVAARTHRVGAAALTVTEKGRRLYDPAIVHTTDPGGVRPVWEFEVGNGSDIRERVLVGTARGEIALHFNDAPGINRVLCDNANRSTISSNDGVPKCINGAARVEGGPPAGTDVNQAYDNLGATSDAYTQLAGIDLTELVGTTAASGQKALMSTVRWCFEDDDCPYPNAFWDGTQMVFGTGFAAADDVVAHELTHGYVERTSGLFWFHQSGAINESVSDVIGEIVDHRNPASNSSDSNWEVGEALPGSGGSGIRSLKDPPLYGQPDRMKSNLFVTADFDYDGGAVHDNNGVGNKTAYLISQGGTFNGVTSSGIDIGDPGLAKTGRLYLDVIARLTSGAEYADLGRVLVSTCAELVASDTAGFTEDDCDSVGSAVAATELSSAPAIASAAAREAPISCPTASSVNTLLQRDDDGIDGFGFSLTSPLWTRAPDAASFVPSYATSGTESLFGFDPNPDLGDPQSGSVTSDPFEVPVSTGGTHLNFHHAYVMDWEGSTYYDGGQVVVEKQVDGVWTKVTDLPWVNGPNRTITGSSALPNFTGFGGDSRGYGSSELDLSSLAGQDVRVSFRVEGDAGIAYYGWWIDDIRLYSCADAVPGKPTVTKHAATLTSATVTWTPPAYVGSGIASYRITRSDGQTSTVSSDTRSATLTGFDTTAPLNVSVAAVNSAGEAGPGTSSTFYPTTTTTSTSTTLATIGRYFTVTGKVTRRGTSTVVASMPVSLQRRMWGKTTWSSLSTGTTTSKGTKAWSVKHYGKATYRVVAKGVANSIGSLGTSRVVGTR